MKLTSVKIGKKRAKVKSYTTKVFEKTPFYQFIPASLARELGYDVNKDFNGLVKVNLNQ